MVKLQSQAIDVSAIADWEPQDQHEFWKKASEIKNADKIADLHESFEMKKYQSQEPGSAKWGFYPRGRLRIPTRSDYVITKVIENLFALETYFGLCCPERLTYLLLHYYRY